MPWPPQLRSWEQNRVSHVTYQLSRFGDIMVLMVECQRAVFTKVDQAHCIFIVFVFILNAISPCTTGLKVLFDPSDCTSTVQLSNY